MSKQLKWIIGVVVGLVVVVPAGALIYYNFIRDEAPPPLSLSQSTATSTPGASNSSGSTSTSTDLAGTWRPTDQSQFGYRVDEVLFGQNKTAAGRTNQVTGSLVINGDVVTSTDLVVDMASVKSDEDRRDNQFRGRIMQVSTYPTATFKLTQPIQLPTGASGGQAVTVKATGDLTVRGVTMNLTVDLNALREGANLKVNGSIPIKFSEWNIPNPTFGPATTEDHGVLEFLVVFAKA